MKKYMIILIAAAMCFAFAACAGNEEIEEEDSYHYQAEDIEIGTDFGTFRSSDLDGNEVTEDVFSAKDVTILNIWGTYCGPCKEEMPELGKLASELPDNAQIIGMVIDVPEGDSEMIGVAKEICKDTGVSYINITDNDSVEALMSSVEAIPTTFILDKEGKTVCTPIIGADVESYKREALNYLGQLE